jgi:hypothetical protein
MNQYKTGEVEMRGERKKVAATDNKNSIDRKLIRKSIFVKVDFP